MPLVSVVIPTRNRPEALTRAVRSVVQQSLSDLEVLVVDDASDDASAAGVGRVARLDSRVRLIRRPSVGGPSSARNDGIWAAEGGLVCCLDDDDEILPGRIEAQVEAIGMPSDRDIAVVTGIEIVWPGRPAKVERLREAGPSLLSEDGPPPFRLRHFLNTYMMPTRLLREVGAYDPALWWGEHTDLFLRLRQHVSFVVVPMAGTRVYRHHQRVQAGQNLEARVSGIRRLLEKHESYFHRHSDERALYLRVLGTSELRLGHRRAAIAALGSAWMGSPSRIGSLARLGIAAIGGRAAWRVLHRLVGEREPL
jgi:glycosyltransferase involved in cell wall biosynthesis